MVLEDTSTVGRFLLAASVVITRVVVARCCTGPDLIVGLSLQKSFELICQISAPFL